MLNECLATRTVAISYAVWFYYRFAASFRDVEDAMAARGVLVSSDAGATNSATCMLQA
jgi:hypothetical protein